MTFKKKLGKILSVQTLAPVRKEHSDSFYNKGVQMNIFKDQDLEEIGNFIFKTVFSVCLIILSITFFIWGTK